VFKTGDLGLHGLHRTLLSFGLSLLEQVLESFAETLLLLVHGTADLPDLALDHFGHLLFQCGQMRLLDHLCEPGDLLPACLALVHDLQGLVHALYLAVDFFYLPEMCTGLLVEYLVSFLVREPDKLEGLRRGECDLLPLAEPQRDLLPPVEPHHGNDLSLLPLGFPVHFYPGVPDKSLPRLVILVDHALGQD
jgi:hypothetical protein